MTTTSDALIKRGILDTVPGSVPTDTFLATLCTAIVGDNPLLAATLLRIDSRGRLDVLGRFGDIPPAINELEGQFATSNPMVISALRDNHSQGPLDDLDATEATTDTVWVSAVGLKRPSMGVLLLCADEPLDLTEEAWGLIQTWSQLWLGRGGGWASAETGPQVDATTSSVVFTSRQLEVLALLGNGLTNAEIGRELSISASLAKQEVAFLAHALRAKNRLDTVVQAQRQGILPVGRG